MADLFWEACYDKFRRSLGLERFKVAIHGYCALFTAPNFSVKTNHSDVNGLKLSEGYRCDSLEFKDLKDTTSNSSVDLVIDEVKFQPFMVKSKNFTESKREKYNARAHIDLFEIWSPLISINLFS